jgi:hypothetical protein
MMKKKFWRKGWWQLKTDHAAEIKTIFCDIDGCVFKHHGNMKEIMTHDCELLPGVAEKFAEWGWKGYTVILITGRPENFRSITERQLIDACLPYDILIMGLPRGKRIVINDIKPGKGRDMAGSINLERNKGMENVDI